MKVKLCGFKDEESVKVACSQKCDFLGFIFYDRSPRFVDLEKAASISKIIPSDIAKVAVVVDADFSFLQEISQKFKPDFFQFHGAETPEFLQKIKIEFPQIKIIKAFKIKDKQDLDQIKFFEKVSDFFLFDSKVENEMGGSGKKFKWQILNNLSTKKEWFLSGGLNVENIVEAIKITGAKMIDISSGIEEIRGKKSPKLILELMKKVKTYVCSN